MSEEVKYTVPESLMKKIYLALFNRQKTCQSGMFIKTTTDYEVTHCIAELNNLTDGNLEKQLIIGEHKHIDTRTMAD